MAAVSLRSVVVWQKNSFKWGVKLFSFESFGLERAIVNRLEQSGIVKPTEIQEKAIGSVMMGKNAIINAETGSGKTLCYLLPVVNRLLIDRELSASRSPYALILLPTVELCYQVAEVFRKVSGPSLLPSIVHKDERLQLDTRHHVVMATPTTLLSYSPTVLENVQVVVIDEADHMITSGGKDVWTLLNSLKTKTTIKNIEFAKRNRKIRDEDRSRRVDEYAEERRTQRRQFVFVAATLPTRGPKAAYNVLRRWLPDVELITSSLVHQTVPEVQIRYVNVKEELKLATLLHCLNSLAGVVQEKSHLEMDNPDENMLGTRQLSQLEGCYEQNEPEEDMTAIVSTDKGERCDNYSSSHNSSNNEGDDCGYSVDHSFPRADQLRVLVFANSAKHAAQTFQFLNGAEDEGGQLSPVHVAKGGKTTPTSRDASEESSSFISTLCTLDKDFWKGKCGQIHKDVSPLERITTLEKFKSGHLKVLVCTDLAARGLDLPRVSHVIQLDFASNAAQVLHRVGRTARAGAHGSVINFVTSTDEDLVRAVRSSETGPGAAGYQPTFSRNRMFRRRVKANKLTVSQMSAQNSS